MRFWAVLLTLLLLVPRVALAAIALECQNDRESGCCCCHKQQERDTPPESGVERTGCCETQAPATQAPLPATAYSELKLPMLALAPQPTGATFELRLDGQSEQRPAQARAPPPERIPLFLKHRALLH